MAESESETGNLDIQKQINDAISARSSLLLKQAEIMRGQVQLAIELQRAMKGEDLDGVSGRLEGIMQAMNAASKEANVLKTATSSIGEAAKNSAVEAKLAANAGKKATSMFFDVLKIQFKAVGAFFSKLKDQISAVGGVISSITRSIVGIGVSLLSIPMGILEKMQEQAADLANAGLELRRAYEDVRKRFGDIATNEGRKVIESFNMLRKESGNLAKSGISLSKIYGIGPEGLATALRDVNDLAGEMGAVFSALGDDAVKNAVSMTIFRKGMGLSGEEMKAFGMEALSRGKKINDVLREVGNLAVQMGKKFGISSKLIGKDVSYMSSNMGRFGSLTKAQMTTASIYVRKLGMEIKDLEGIMSAFEDFETAAVNASKLAQSFGMNVDAMEMLKEQDPTKQLDMLRKAFAETGRSIETMNRAEKKLLASTAGIPENMVEAALSAKNMGKSYEEIQAAAEGAADKQLTQEEIMQKMAKNIERTFAPITYVAGLLNNFMSGFTTGLVRNNPLIHAMAKAIGSTYNAGLALGTWLNRFMNQSEGLYVLVGIYNNISKNVWMLTSAFEKFFTLIKKGDIKGAARGLVKDLEEFFSSIISKDGMKKLTEGYSAILATLMELLANTAEIIIPRVTQSLVDGLDAMIAAIPASLDGISFGEMKDKVTSPIGRIFASLVDMAAKVAPKVWEFVTKLFDLVWNDPATGPYLRKGLLGLITYVFGPPLIKAGLVIISESLILLFKDSVKSAFKRQTIGAAIRGAGVGETVSTGIFEGIEAAVASMNPVSLAIAIVAVIGAALAIQGKMLELIGKETFMGIFSNIFGTDLLNSFYGWVFDWMTSAASSILSGLSDIFGGISGAFGALFSGDIDSLETELLRVLSGLGEFLWGMIKGLVASSLQNVVTGVGLIVRGLGTILMAAIDILGKAFVWLIDGATAGAFGKWVKPISDAWSKVKSWWSGKSTSESDEMKNASEKAGEKAGAGFFDGLSGGLKSSQKTAEQQLSSVTGTVKQYTEKSSSDIQEEAKKINKGLDNINSLLTLINKDKMKQIESTMSTLPTEIIEKASAFTSNILSLFQSFNQISSALKEMGGLSINVGAFTSTFSLIDSFSKFLTVGVNGKKLFSVEDIDAAIGNLDKIDMFIGRLDSTFKAYSTFMTAAAKIPAAAITQAANVTASIIDDVRRVDAALADLGDVDINATIEKVGKSLGIKDTVLKIERKPIQMNVQLNLTMKAEDIAKEIFEVAYKMARPGEGVEPAPLGVKNAFVGANYSG